MTVLPWMLNGHGMCHGGLVFTLADTAFAHACNSHGPATVAAAASIDFLAPANEGDELVAEAVEQHRRGRTGLYDVVGDGRRRHRGRPLPRPLPRAQVLPHPVEYVLHPEYVLRA